MKNNTRRFFHLGAFIAAGAFTFASSCAQAGVTVYPIETSLGINGASQVKVTSGSKNVEFVKVTVKKILNPGTKQEKEVAVDMTGDGSLIATPQKLAIAAGGERTVRLVTLTAPAKETTWRVYFEGVSENEFNGSGSKSNAADVGVNIVWGVLVHVAPQKALVSLRYNPETGDIANDGTLRVPLNEVGECAPAGGCVWKKETKTVYPGTSVKLSTVTFRAGHAYRVRYLNWISGKTAESEVSPAAK